MAFLALRNIRAAGQAIQRNILHICGKTDETLPHAHRNTDPTVSVNLSTNVHLVRLKDALITKLYIAWLAVL